MVSKPVTVQPRTLHLLQSPYEHVNLAKKESAPRQRRFGMGRFRNKEAEGWTVIKNTVWQIKKLVNPLQIIYTTYKKELAQRPIPSDLQRCGVISYKVKRIGRMATKKEVSSWHLLPYAM